MRAVPATSAVLLIALGAATGCSHVDDARAPQVSAVTFGAAEATATDGYYGDAVDAIRGRDYGRALDLLQMARRRNAADVRVLNAFGVVYDKLGRFDLSARYYGQALALDPNSTVVQANLAYSNVLLRTWGAANPEPAAVAAVAAVQPSAPPPAEVPVVVAAAAPVAIPVAPVIASGRAPVAGPVAAPVRAPIAAAADPVPVPVAAASAAVVLPVSTRPAVHLVPAALPMAVPLAAAIAGPAARALPPRPHLAATPARSTPPAATRRPTQAHVFVVKALGQETRAQSIARRLKALGWTARVVRGQPLSGGRRTIVRTIIRYPAERLALARALARSLPGSAQLSLCRAACALQIWPGAEPAHAPRRAVLARVAFSRNEVRHVE